MTFGVRWRAGTTDGDTVWRGVSVSFLAINAGFSESPLDGEALEDSTEVDGRGAVFATNVGLSELLREETLDELTEECRDEDLLDGRDAIGRGAGAAAANALGVGPIDSRLTVFPDAARGDHRLGLFTTIETLFSTVLLMPLVCGRGVSRPSSVP